MADAEIGEVGDEPRGVAEREVAVELQAVGGARNDHRLAGAPPACRAEGAGEAGEGRGGPARRLKLARHTGCLLFGRRRKAEEAEQRGGGLRRDLAPGAPDVAIARLGADPLGKPRLEGCIHVWAGSVRKTLAEAGGARAPPPAAVA